MMITGGVTITGSVTLLWVKPCLQGKTFVYCCCWFLQTQYVPVSIRALRERRFPLHLRSKPLLQHMLTCLSDITFVPDRANTESWTVSSVHEPEAGNGQSERSQAIEWTTTLAWNIGHKHRQHQQQKFQQKLWWSSWYLTSASEKHDIDDDNIDMFSILDNEVVLYLSLEDYSGYGWCQWSLD